MPIITLSENSRKLSAAIGENLLNVLKKNGIYPDAPCGGNGTCGKCKILVNGMQTLACRTVIDQDMTVALPQGQIHILQDSLCVEQGVNSIGQGYLLAFDIGTTSVVCFLLDGNSGTELARSSMINPQVAFGADVITRIQKAVQGELAQLTQTIRQAMADLIQTVCAAAEISAEQVGVVSVVGNPAMQQIFLGISPENLSKIPFAPALTQAKAVSCKEILPICPKAQLLIVPDIAGFIGADTVGCLLATKLYEKDSLTLLVDIGTNGEMVLGNKNRMVSCATAAGPALEGANIRFGMRATNGAIDHVWLEDGKILCSVIGDSAAKGICGSGLIDAVAAGLKLGLINKRGKILTNDGILRLTEAVYLTQEDIRQVQLAKGAICAGVCLLADQLGLAVTDIQQVQLAGAFGSFLNPENACRIGLLPEVLSDRIQVVGNAAGSGAKLLACNKNLLPLAKELTNKVEFVELANLPMFPKTFALAMGFREEIQ